MKWTKFDAERELSKIASASGVASHLLASGEVLDGSYLVFKLEGYDLEDYVSQRLSRAQLLNLAKQFLDKVTRLHELNIAHQDLKPGNIVVSPTTEILWIIDYGLAEQIVDGNTMSKRECGTDGWMAPEKEFGVPYDMVLADLWSVGKILMWLSDGTREGRVSRLVHRLGDEIIQSLPQVRRSAFNTARQSINDLHRKSLNNEMSARD